jgi:hypothetical protein
MNDLPAILVDSVRRVYSDGCHNAFTDLCRFRGSFYLAFRSHPVGHGVLPGSSVVVLESPDGGDWREIFRFGVPGRDVRDPHFLAFGGRLFVYSGAWLCDPARAPDIRDHLGYGAWTDDGRAWQGPRALEGTAGHYVWRAAAHGERAYLCGRRISQAAGADGTPADLASVMLASGDGFAWRPAGLFQETGGNETAFLFEPDGGVLAIARHRKDNAQLCRARPPWRDWTRTDLGRFIGGPLLADWGPRRLVGGRRVTVPGEPRTVLSWLAGDQLHDMVELPSGGDNSYPGFVALDDRRGFVSWYSSHEGSGGKGAPADIYLARLRLA